VGAFVSGPIDELFVDFNDVVTEGQLLAKIDERLYKSNVLRDKAALANREAEVLRVQSQLQQAINDEERANKLFEENEDYISESELDVYRFARQSLDAQVTLAETGVAQAQASLTNAEANLEYTNITSPVDGMIIDRKIDPGQTLASSFQTPELFVIAENMEKEMYIFASIVEAEIGMIKDASKREQPVEFTIDAYPDELFEGKIHQIRMSSATNQNVVTYPVVVTAPNPDMKLMPGMTANLSFQIDEKDDIILVPNAALRFFPQREHVRPQDHKLLDGTGSSDDDDDADDKELSATEKAETRRKRNRRHVWVKDGDLLKAIEVEVGLSDYKHMELVSGDLKVGQKLVTDVKSK
jgi:HlyD family secretion protein